MDLKDCKAAQSFNRKGCSEGTTGWEDIIKVNLEGRGLD
jgi:hypothetical protein